MVPHHLKFMYQVQIKWGTLIQIANIIALSLWKKAVSKKNYYTASLPLDLTLHVLVIWIKEFYWFALIKAFELNCVHSQCHCSATILYIVVAQSG